MNAAPDNYHDALESLLMPCTYAEALTASFIGLTRPDGYFGDRVSIRLALVDQQILEIHTSGYHTCPVVACAVDHAEVEWLIDHHPGFRAYRRVV